MKIKSRFFCCCFAFVCACFIFVSCASKGPKEYSIPNYSDFDIKRAAIEDIERLSVNKPIQALWITYLLVTNS